MPVGENSKESILYMKNEDGAWVRLGKISAVGDIKEDPVGLEMDGMAVSFDKSISMVFECQDPNEDISVFARCADNQCGLV